MEVDSGNGGQSSRPEKKSVCYTLRPRKPQKSRSKGKVSRTNKVSKPTKELEEEYNSDDEDYYEERIDEIYRQNEKFEKTSRKYANTAIDYYNFKEGNNNYEVVKLGSVGATSLGRDVIIHTNFKAKRKDDPDAPVKMFFAQLKLLGRADYVLTQRMIVEDCTNLGPCKELPGLNSEGQVCGVVEVSESAMEKEDLERGNYLEKQLDEIYR